MNIRVISLVKGGATYVFRYAPGCEGRLVEEIIRLAEDPSSRLDWLDAARLGFQITQHALAECHRRPAPTAAEATEGP